MNASGSASTPRIRLVFELSRDDHPRLYDDLIRFPKGTKRINRLRVLAYDGLLVQGGQLQPMIPSADSSIQGQQVGVGGNSLMNDLFQPSVD